MPKKEEIAKETAITLEPTFWDAPKEAEKVLHAIKNKKSMDGPVR